MNERDSEIMGQLLSQSGYIPVGEQTDADLVILNTCSIRAKAEQKVFSLLGIAPQAKKAAAGTTHSRGRLCGPAGRRADLSSNAPCGYRGGHPAALSAAGNARTS